MQLVKNLATFFSSAEELVSVSSAGLGGAGDGESDLRGGEGRDAGGKRRQEVEEAEEEAGGRRRRRQRLLSVGADVQVQYIFFI